MFRFATVLFATLFLLSAAYAQGNTKEVYQRDTNPDFFKKLPDINPKDVPNREIGGVVRDAYDNPVKGAIVTLTNMKTKAARSFVTKEDGRYAFDRVIKADDYEVRARFRGRDSDTKKLTTYDPRNKPVLNLRFDKSIDEPEEEAPSKSAAAKKPAP
ncbi:MAG: carboxypeptidase-like regulatory domain-containing protein [Bryobacterales bacterium]|nr:carboxypeptidase-like regulatory domain-containing protein [Bryobacterales bacterium]